MGKHHTIFLLLLKCSTYRVYQCFLNIILYISFKDWMQLNELVRSHNYYSTNSHSLLISFSISKAWLTQSSKDHIIKLQKYIGYCHAIAIIQIRVLKMKTRNRIWKKKMNWLKLKRHESKGCVFKRFFSHEASVKVYLYDHLLVEFALSKRIECTLTQQGLLELIIQ